MRQAVMTSPGVIEHREVAEPAAGPGQVLLRIKRIGVCGSDVHVNHGKHPFTSYPVVQGHEFSAVVEAVGDGVERIPPGSKATATPQVVCGQCGLRSPQGPGIPGAGRGPGSLRDRGRKGGAASRQLHS
jgi:threonine dehydrogenase-like Zn-dependent dehydrogenase